MPSSRDGPDEARVSPAVTTVTLFEHDHFVRVPKHFVDSKTYHLIPALTVLGPASLGTLPAAPPVFWALHSDHEGLFRWGHLHPESSSLPAGHTYHVSSPRTLVQWFEVAPKSCGNQFDSYVWKNRLQDMGRFWFRVKLGPAHVKLAVYTNSPHCTASNRYVYWDKGDISKLPECHLGIMWFLFVVESYIK